MKKRKSVKTKIKGLNKHGRKYRRRIVLPDGTRAWETFDTLEAGARAIVSQTSDCGVMSKGIERYTRDELVKLSPETQRTEKPRLKRLDRVFGHMHPDDITQQDIYLYLDSRPTIAANRELARLSAVLKHMIRWGMATKNPCVGIMRTSEADRARTRYLTNEEYYLALAVALDRAFHGMPSASIWYGVSRLEYLTGRRGSDQLRLKRTDLRDDGIFYLEGKTGKATIIEWSDELRVAVADVKRICARKESNVVAWLIPDMNGARCKLATFNKVWQQLRPYMAMADILPFEPRDVRAKFSTDFQLSGGDASEALRHSDTRITRKHYIRVPVKVRPLK